MEFILYLTGYPIWTSSAGQYGAHTASHRFPNMHFIGWPICNWGSSNWGFVQEHEVMPRDVMEWNGMYCNMQVCCFCLFLGLGWDSFLFFVCVCCVWCVVWLGDALTAFGTLWGFFEAFLWLKLDRRPLQRFKAVCIVINGVNWHKRYPCATDTN